LRGNLSSVKDLSNLVEDLVLPFERIIPVLKASAEDIKFSLDLFFLFHEKHLSGLSFFRNSLVTLLFG
jgi:hypothetical protein